MPADDQSKFAKQPSFVEIPSNLNSLSAKELKQILDGLGIKCDDCFEKSDLIARIKEYQEKKGMKRQQTQEAPPKKQSEPAAAKENKKPA